MQNHPQQQRRRSALVDTSTAAIGAVGKDVSSSSCSVSGREQQGGGGGLLAVAAAGAERLCHRVSFAIAALWDTLRDTLFPAFLLRGASGPQAGRKGSRKAFLLSAGRTEGQAAPATSEEDASERTTAFMTASAILINASIVLAAHSRVPVKQAISHACQIVREVFTAGVL
jgi:hypothetical protein